MRLTKRCNPRIVSYHFSASADRHGVLHCEGAADDRAHLQERPGGAMCGMCSDVSLCLQVLCLCCLLLSVRTQ